jgi:molybdopterin synthase catalytic subunit
MGRHPPRRGEPGPQDVDHEGAVVRRPIDPQRLLAAVASPLAGANVVFVGTARSLTGGTETRSLEYEAHDRMAGPALERLCTAAVDRFGLEACAVEHRVGRITPGEASVAIAVSAAHRQAAFEAAEWLMERIKQDVPIWKCEERADGHREWMHPGDMPGGPAEPGRGRS